MLKLAHRGDWSAGPENSVLALVTACGIPGVDGVEFDVRLSADGTPVLVHDADLLRLLGIRERVRDLTAGQLSARGVATLADALAALPARAFLDVELKEPIVAAVAPLLLEHRGPAPRNAVVASFEPTILEDARRAIGGWPRWLNVDAIDGEAIATAIGLGCEALACANRGVDVRAVVWAGSAGLRVVAWPVARRSRLERLRRLGVYAVCAEGDALRA